MKNLNDFLKILMIFSIIIYLINQKVSYIFKLRNEYCSFHHIVYLTPFSAKRLSGLMQEIL